MQNIQEEFRICSSLCIVIILIIHVVNSLKMYILEQKYQKMCTTLQFRCAIFQIFIENRDIFFKTLTERLLKVWNLVRFLKCVIFHKILSCNYNDAKPPVGCRRGEHLAKDWKGNIIGFTLSRLKSNLSTRKTSVRTIKALPGVSTILFIDKIRKWKLIKARETLNMDRKCETQWFRAKFRFVYTIMTVTSKTVGQTYQTWFGNGIIHMTYNHVSQEPPGRRVFAKPKLSFEKTLFLNRFPDTTFGR